MPHQPTINPRLAADHLENLEQTLALELALGASLPKAIPDWPLGLAVEWNAAAAKGALDSAATFGDLARAFLAHRTAHLARCAV